MASEDLLACNKANWDERAPLHANSPDYFYQRLLKDPNIISDVVKFDIPLLGDISGLEVVHLQCHIATDTLSLARRGAKSVVGLDFSSASIKEARKLADNAAGGEKLSFVESPVYDALDVLPAASFDLVFTGIGALCWLPSVRPWAHIVSALLKPGGRLFIREGHPVLWSLDEKVESSLQVNFPYFERAEPLENDEPGTYVRVPEGQTFTATKTREWNHGLGEIIQALIDEGMIITGLVEHKSVPWDALPGKLRKVPTGESEREHELVTDQDRVPLTYTLQATKK